MNTIAIYVIAGIAIGALSLFLADRYIFFKGIKPMAAQKPTWKSLRDIILFFGGLLGVGFETIVADTPRESLLVLFAAMLGLPAFLRADEKRESNGNGNGSNNKKD